MNLKKRGLAWGLALTGAFSVLPSAGVETWRPVPLGEVRVGGVIGERIALTVTNNLMKLDLEKDFIEQFRTKSGKKAFIGTGNVIEAFVCLAKYTGDPDVLARKRRLVDAILAAQTADGYIGCMDRAHRTWFAWDVEDIGFILDGLVLDYRLFGEKRSLEGAKRAAEDVLEQWRTTVPPKGFDTFIYDKELLMGLGHGMWALYEATGDARYADFVAETRGYLTADTPVVLGRGRGLEGHVAGYLDTCFTQLEMYRTRTDPRLVRQTNRFLNHYLHANGGLVHGIEGICECFSGDQAGSGFAGETCMSAYVLCTLDLALRTGACEPSLAGDVMERLLYNGFFAAQSRDGRKLRYYMPVSGVRPWWPTDDYCCPCNYRRIIGHLPEYVFYTSDRGVLANLFTAAEARLALAGGTVRLTEETDYPTTGNVRFTVRPEKGTQDFALSFRLPRWCTEPSVRVNGRTVAPAKRGALCTVDRTWSAGDVVEVALPMAPRLVRGRGAQSGRCAILRGPILYAMNDRKLAMERGNWAEGSGNDAATVADVMTVEPKSLALVTGDGSARSDGTAIRVRASLVPYQLGMDCPWAAPQEVLFTEFADPENTLTYFRLPAKEDEGVVDDELFDATSADAGPSSSEPLVGRTGFDQPAEWQRKPFCGRDFFPLLMNVYWAAPGCADVPEGFSVYRECGWRAIGAMPDGVNDLVMPKGGWKDGYAELLPEDRRRKEPYRLWDFFAKRINAKYADRFYTDADTDRPFLLFLGGIRPEMRLNRTYPLADRRDFAAWKAKHPNYFGNYTMMEFDHETSHYFITFKETKDGAAMTRLEEAFPCTFKDWAWNTDIFDTWIEEAKRRSVEFYFGEDNQWAFSSGTPGLVPLFARAGCKGVCYEATTQSMTANWRFAGAYLRGAARQFGMSYGWYTANWYTGYFRDDPPTVKAHPGENSLSGTSKQWKTFGPNKGCSFQMIDRQNAYGWLIGARYVEPENWYWYHREKVERVEKVEEVEKKVVEYVPSAAAKDFQALYDLSKREDRGLMYSPLALLFPIHEKVSIEGKQLYSTGYRQTAALLTLAPTTPVRDLRRYGQEGGFYNSEFGEIFDIVCPDATNDVERTLAALRPYKAAALFGRFRAKNLAPAAFTRYVEEGGTLFLSEEYVVDGVVEAKATGVTFPHRKVLAAGEYLVDDCGAKTALKQPYILHVGEPTTAEVFWRDEKGQPIAYLNRVGKGKVVTVTASGMLPEGWMKAWGIPDSVADNDDFLRLYHQDVTCEIMRAVFRRVQEETMPFAVTGDIHWGVNKVERCDGGEVEKGDRSTTSPLHRSTRRRWLVWFFNNKGIENYIGEAPVVHREADAKVVVTGANGVRIKSARDIRAVGSAAAVRTDGNSFEITIPAGGWAAVEVTSEDVR